METVIGSCGIAKDIANSHENEKNALAVLVFFWSPTAMSPRKDDMDPGAYCWQHLRSRSR